MRLDPLTVPSTPPAPPTPGDAPASQTDTDPQPARPPAAVPAQLAAALSPPILATDRQSRRRLNNRLSAWRARERARKEHLDLKLAVQKRDVEIERLRDEGAALRAVLATTQRDFAAQFGAPQAPADGALQRRIQEQNVLLWCQHRAMADLLDPLQTRAGGRDPADALASAAARQILPGGPAQRREAANSTPAPVAKGCLGLAPPAAVDRSVRAEATQRPLSPAELIAVRAGQQAARPASEGTLPTQRRLALPPQPEPDGLARLLQDRSWIVELAARRTRSRTLPA